MIIKFHTLCGTHGYVRCTSPFFATSMWTAQLPAYTTWLPIESLVLTLEVISTSAVPLSDNTYTLMFLFLQGGSVVAVGGLFVGMAVDLVVSIVDKKVGWVELVVGNTAVVVVVVAVFVVVVVAGVVYCGSGQKKNANIHRVSVLWEHREAEKTDLVIVRLNAQKYHNFIWINCEAGSPIHHKRNLQNTECKPRHSETTNCRIQRVIWVDARIRREL